MSDAVSVVLIVFVHAHIVLPHPFISGVLSFPSALEEELVQKEELDESQADSAHVVEKVMGELRCSCDHAHLCICEHAPF